MDRDRPVPDAPATTEPLLPLSPPRSVLLRLRFRAADHVGLPAAAAAVWRGLLGARLHALGPCDSAGGLYDRVFAPSTRAIGPVAALPSHVRGRLGLGNSAAPRPFVLRTADAGRPEEPVSLAPGDLSVVEVVLLEPITDALPAIAQTLERAAASVGRAVPQSSGRTARGRLALESAELSAGRASVRVHDGGRWTLPTPWPGQALDALWHLERATTPDGVSVAGGLDVEVVTPLRLSRRGRDVGPADLSPSVLAGALYRRLGGLVACYAPQTVDEGLLAQAEDALYALARRTRLDPYGLRRVDRHRFSHRQRREVPAGGLHGRFRLHAPPADLARWYALLTHADRLHLGKGTTFGQGRLRPA